MGHVLVASDSIPPGFEHRVDNLAATLSNHVGATPLARARRSPRVIAFTERVLKLS
jgi:hypothetical protein